MIEFEDVMEQAFAVLDHAYVPYSNYRVGACIKLNDGTLIQGVNIENASFGLTNCAERSAIFTAYSQGYRKADIQMMAVVSNAEKLTTPCGACRQVLAELLMQDTPIILSNRFETRITNIKELLPMNFSQEDLT